MIFQRHYLVNVIGSLFFFFTCSYSVYIIDTVALRASAFLLLCAVIGAGI